MSTMAGLDGTGRIVPKDESAGASCCQQLLRLLRGAIESRGSLTVGFQGLDCRVQTPERRGAFLALFLAALQREEQLRGSTTLPGDLHHDPKLWQAYLAAVDETTKASEQYCQSSQ